MGARRARRRDRPKRNRKVEASLSQRRSRSAREAMRSARFRFDALGGTA
jgi:hypothetical protein